MTPLNLEQTLSYLRERMPAPFDLPQLAHLCRTGQLTPLFAYDRYALDQENYDYDRIDCVTFNLSGYLTAPELIEVIYKDKTIELDIAIVYEFLDTISYEIKGENLTSMKGRKVILLNKEYNYALYQRDPKYSVFSDNDSVTITRNDLLFDLEQLERIAPAGYTQSQADKPKPLPVIGEYTTPAMQAMNAVINEFWIEYTPDKIPPKQENVINWIMENYGFSRNLSLAIEQVARPDSAKTGGNKAV
ncbi:hypothetical protein [Moraxella osloensis]|uniref:hypothetical protein n=1 Tax=Faucicola osloensis TaxID=34062 RepID=UPI002002D29E|nr:hypothetical protein [Moraxella osloensis]MCK6051897.1 hypothetical protein [Moraxella osloensis]